MLYLVNFRSKQNGTGFNKFIDKLKCYMEITFDDTEYMFCLITYKEDPTKTFEGYNMPEDIYEGEAYPP